MSYESKKMLSQPYGKLLYKTSARQSGMVIDTAEKKNKENDK